jgi:hypothetical protein
MANKNPYTWQKLKDFCNKLPEKELKKEVIWWGEEQGGSVSSAYQLKEDYVETDYGCEPLSAQDPIKDDEEPWEVAYPKGTPIISVD